MTLTCEYRLAVEYQLEDLDGICETELHHSFSDEVGEVRGYWTRERFFQNRVKEGKKRSWNKRNVRETAWQSFNVYTLMQKDRHSYLCHGRKRTCSALESKRTGSLDVS